MSCRVREILDAARLMAARRNEVLEVTGAGRHSYGVRVRDRLAPLPSHEGEATEVEMKDIRRFCRKLDWDVDQFLALLREN